MNRTHRILLWVILAMPLVCCLGSILMVQAQKQAVTAKLKALTVEAEKAGMPVTVDQIEKEYKVPEEKNAAPIYREARNLVIPGGPDERGFIAYANGEASAPNQTVLTVLNKLHLAAQRPFCNWDRDPKKGAMLQFSELATLKYFAKALAQDAEHKAKKGEWRAAIIDLQTGQKLATHIGQDNYLISMLVQVACDAIIDHRLRAIAWQQRDNGAFLEAAQELVDQPLSPISFRDIMAVEYVLGKETIRQLKGMSQLSYTEEGDPQEQEPSQMERIVFRNQYVQTNFQYRFLKAYLEAYKNLPEDPDDFEGVRKEFQAMERRIEADKNLFNTLNQVLMPIYTQTANAAIRRSANRRQSQVTVRLLRDRLRNGRLPKDLKAYGNLATDPFSGKQFGYRLKPGGFVLYSIGQDRKDDGGVKRIGFSGRDDIVELPPPPERTRVPASP